MSRVGNWIGQSTSTIGQGAIQLDGLIEGYVPFNSIGDGLVYYAISDGFNREAGTGILNGNILSRSGITATLVSGELTTVAPLPLSLSGSALVFCTFNKQAFDKFNQSTGIGEAPINANAYVRKNASWQIATKSDVGLANVDNTSDFDKPISSATQLALDDKATSAQGSLADSSLQPGDNVSELVNDAGYITSSDIPVDSVNGQTGVVVITPTTLGLGNVDNTSDIDKPVSTDTQSALDLKFDKTGGNVSGRIEIDDPTNYVETGTANELTLASGVGVRVDAPIMAITGAIGREGSYVTVGEFGVLLYTDPPEPTVTWQDTDVGPLAIPISTLTPSGLSVVPTQDVDLGTIQWSLDFENLAANNATVTIQMTLDGTPVGPNQVYIVSASDTARLNGSAPVFSTIPDLSDVSFTIISNRAGNATNLLLRIIQSGASTSAEWGSITGTLSAQTDLTSALNGKAAIGAAVSIFTNDANYTSVGDNVSGFTNDADFTAVGDNISVFTNDAGYITAASVPVDSVNGQTGVVVLVKADVGLSNVDNTTDLNKPISTATQTALNGKATTAQGALADTSLQSGDNISLLTNDSNYTIVGSNITQFANNAGYLTSAPAATWGSITGTLSSQTDLQTALDTKFQSGQSYYARGAVSSSITGGGIILPFATQVFTNVSMYSYAAGVLTVLVTGRYKIAAEFTAFNNVTVQYRLNGANITGTLHHLYTPGGTPNSVSMTHVMDITAGQTISVWTQATSGDTVTEANASRFIVERA